MDKWDNKDKTKDEFFDKIMKVLPQYLEGMNKPIAQTFHFSANLTKEQLKKVSEVLQ